MENRENGKLEKQRNSETREIESGESGERIREMGKSEIEKIGK